VEWFTRDRHLFLLSVAFYGLSMIYSVFLWKRGFRQHNRVNYLLLSGGFVLHTLAVFKRGHAIHQCPVTNLYEITALALWGIVCAYVLVGLWSRMRFLGAFISPFLVGIGIFALMPSLDASHGGALEAATVWTSVHAAIFAMAYGAFGLSSAAALMYLSQEWNLKFNKLKAVLSLLPSIQRLELILGRLLLAGFALLTAGLITALIDFYRLSNLRSYYAEPKIIWSLLVWALYLGLVLMRWLFHQHGRRIALGAVGGFVFVLLTFWGTTLLSPLHNQNIGQ
jgi:ABC-type transport system involved in cytochrome c biogenesis permease subunit